jgi:GxxExxY protein
MIHEELSGKIIGAAMDVLNELRPGLDEKLYERAMIIELKRRGHSLSIQKSISRFLSRRINWQPHS